MLKFCLEMPINYNKYDINALYIFIIMLRDDDDMDQYIDQYYSIVVSYIYNK